MGPPRKVRAIFLHAMPLLDIRTLAIHFQTEGGVVEAVKGISLTLEKGETLAIIGESGSGKSVTGLALTRLQPRFNPLAASLVRGCLWAIWILPFPWKQGWIGGERTFLVLAVIPGAILSTWIYNISGGSRFYQIQSLTN